MAKRAISDRVSFSRACFFSSIWVGVLVLLLAALPAFAQSNGAILGVIKDSTGGSVPDARITLTSVETNAVRTTTTGSDGEYRVSALQPGHYSVKVEKSGFKTMTQTGVTLDVAAEITVNASLEVGSSTQQVTVTGEAPLVETTTSSLGGLINDDNMAELPLNGRNFIDLALLQPGVNNYTNMENTQAQGGIWGVVFSANGAPVRSNTFTIDGASMMNLHGTAASGVGTTLGVDGIKEYKVISSAFPAEYGQQMGSQVVIVSKGGTNQIHGDVFEYLRNSSLDARNFFDYSYITTGKRLPELQRSNFGGSIGGPIQKDKTFFYGVYEALRLNFGETLVQSVFPSGCYVPTGNPCATSSSSQATVGTVAPAVRPLLALFPQPNLPNNQFTFPFSAPTTINFGQMRIDHNFSASDSFFARYTIQDPYNTNALIYPGDETDSFGRDQFLTFSESHIFSPTVLNTVRASFSRTNLQQFTTYPASQTSPQTSFVPGFPTGQLTIGGVTTFNISNAPNRLLQNIYSLSDDVYYTKGKHAFKFGTLLNRYEQYLDSTNGTRGTLTFLSMASFLAGNYSAGTYFSSYNGNKSPLFYTIGFYGQDDWRVSTRLTLNLGLRYEFNTNLRDRLGNAWNFVPCVCVTTSTLTQGLYTTNPSYKNFSPRVGFAYDVFGNGKTSIRSAFGMYYDLANYGFQINGSSNGQPPLTNQITLAAGTLAALPISTINGTGSKSTLGGLEYQIHQPTMLQWNLAIEQQLAPNLSLSVAYVGTRGMHLWDQEEGNPCQPNSVTNGIPFWATDCGLGRLNPAFANDGYRATNADSSYNGLQVVGTKRLSHGLQFAAAYTYSKVIDDVQGQFGPGDCANSTGNTAVADSTYAQDRRFDRGPACFNATHNLRMTFLYHLPPVKSDNALLRGALNGWWMGSLVSWETGEPLNIITNASRSRSDNLGTAGGQHVNLGTATVAPGAVGPDGTVNTAKSSTGQTFTFIPYNAATVVTGNPQQWFNPLMFNPGAVGFLGTASRNIVEGPHLSDFDMSFNKDTAAHFLGEAGLIQFRAELFNIFNHANFGMPNGAAYAGTVTDVGQYSEAPLSNAGQITSTITTARQIQLSLKLIF